MRTKNQYAKGLVDGIPIGLGYLSVSFGFGIMAISAGLYWWQALLISMTTLTSAGQLAGIGVMANPGQYVPMLVSQATINIRYSFMAVSLSQKTDSKFRGIFRAILGFFITDEIFAVAVSRKSVSRSYFIGLATLPWIGWATGTLVGALAGNILPSIVMNALCIMMYAMFVAVVVPPVAKSKPLFAVVLFTALISAAFYFLPVLRDISSGISISICAVASACFGAVVFPRKEGDED
ncbi:MAG: AzlC family ABC transporter permease [Ruminococcaceae bacterium]|nr:AzlC family ABC transporter permease [Oscillospiraceae bacterium]